MSEPEYHVALSCWTCHTEQYGLTNTNVQSALDLMAVANAAGWKSRIDSFRSRVLIFCSDECTEKALTKKGEFRARRPKKPETL